MSITAAGQPATLDGKPVTIRAIREHDGRQWANCLLPSGKEVLVPCESERLEDPNGSRP